MGDQLTEQMGERQRRNPRYALDLGRDWSLGGEMLPELHCGHPAKRDPRWKGLGGADKLLIQNSSIIHVTPAPVHLGLFP